MMTLKRLCNRSSLDNQRRCTRWLIYLGIFLVVAGAIIAGIAYPVFRLAVKPRVKATIEDARLNIFAYAAVRPGDAPTFLAYNISAAIRIHNPTWTTIKLTKPLLAAFAFHDQRLFTVSVAGEGHKYRTSKKEVHLVHAGGEVPSHVLGAALMEDFEKQNKTGAFKIDVRLSGEIAYLGLDNMGNKRAAGFSCPTTLQLAPPGLELLVFHEVKCLPEAENIDF